MIKAKLLIELIYYYVIISYIITQRVICGNVLLYLLNDGGYYMKLLFSLLILLISFNSQASFLDRLNDFFTDSTEAIVETATCPSLLLETGRTDSISFRTNTQLVPAIKCERSIKKCNDLIKQKQKLNPESGFVCILAEDRDRLANETCDYRITNFWGGQIDQIRFLGYGVGIDNARSNACATAKKICERKVNLLKTKNILRKTYKAKCELDY